MLLLVDFVGESMFLFTLVGGRLREVVAVRSPRRGMAGGGALTRLPRIEMIFLFKGYSIDYQLWDGMYCR